MGDSSSYSNVPEGNNKWLKENSQMTCDIKIENISFDLIMQNIMSQEYEIGVSPYLTFNIISL